MNSMKRQKDTTLKDELPSLVDAQCASGGKQTNSSKRCEEAEPKQKQCPVWMSLVVEVKSEVVKNILCRNLEC